MKKNTHKSLSGNSAKLRLASLGALVGIVAGLLVNLFRYILESTFPLISQDLHHEDFEALSPQLHFFLPIIGCLLIGLIIHNTAPSTRMMGVTYVIDKVQNFKGFLHIKNAALQFVTATLALLTGGSCGREGPAIHMGATSGSALAQVANLPNNSVRTLIAAGSAAAIAASFNTPMAGVVFALEVIMMEYSLAGIIPIIIAAVGGTVVTQILYGNEPVFLIENINMNSLYEIPYIVLSGIIIGVLAGTFIHLHKYCLRFSQINIRIRLLIVGVLTGSTALFVPEVMGMGYDTLNEAFKSNLGLSFLIILLISKLTLTAISLGLGLPGGVIGPAMVIGGFAGAALGALGNQVMGIYPSTPAFYALLGMCAMMGAVLQAPLAALLALLELSNNPSIILPAMLIIVAANLTCSELFKLPSIFHTSLLIQGSKQPNNLARLLHRYGVGSILNSKVEKITLDSSPAQIEAALENNPEWIMIDSDKELKSLIKADLIFKLSESKYTSLEETLNQNSVSVTPISIQSTLQEAMEIFQDKQLQYGYIYSQQHNKKTTVIGIITVDDIIAFYKNN